VKLADKAPLPVVEQDVEVMMKAEDEDAFAVRKQF
jgi:hypothetical protein